MMPSLEQQLVASPAKSFLYFLFIRSNIRDVGLRVAGDAVKITELTIGDTYVRGIHITINLPGHLSIRLLDLPQFIRHKDQFSGRGIFKQEYPLFNGQEVKLQ